MTLQLGFHAVAGSAFHAFVAPPDFVVSAAPTSGGSTLAGGTASYNVTITSLFGFASPVTLSNSAVTGLPQGATASFSASPVTPPANGSTSVTLTISTAPGITGNYALTVVGTSPGLVAHYATSPLSVQDFSVSISPSTTTIPQGGTATFAITTAPVNGYKGTVNFSVNWGNGGDYGAGYQWNPTNSVSVGGTVTYTVTDHGGGVGLGWAATLTAYANGVAHYPTFWLGIGPPVSPPAVSCSGSPALPALGQTVTFTANASGGTSPYSYTWSGSVSGAGQSASFAPTAAGNYGAQVTVTDAAGRIATAACSVAVQQPVTVTINVPSPLTVAAGQSTTLGITSTAIGGYSGAVTYGYDPTTWPSAIAATFSPFSPTGSPWSSNVTVFTTNSAAPGSYALPIFAIAGGATQNATITLTVTPALKPRDIISGVGVTMYSQIIFYPASKQIETFSITTIDYSTAAYYQAAAEMWLYKNGAPFDPYEHGYDVEDTTANAGIRDANNNPVLIDASDGSDYSMDSEHYLSIWYPVAAYDVYGDNNWEDTYGYSLLPSTDPSEEPNDDFIAPPFEDVYWVSQLIDLGPTGYYIDTSDKTPFISSISPNSWTPSPSAQTSVVVAIAGSNFGTYGPASSLAISGDNTVQLTIVDWADTGSPGGGLIHASLTFAPAATPGDRVVTVTSGGVIGSGVPCRAGAAS
jgi:hypothetical protein